MYQQRPFLPEGNLFKRGWFKHRFDIEGEQIRLDGGEVFDRSQTTRFVVVDPAASEKETADYTAMGVFATLPGNRLLVLDMVRERLPLEAIVPRLHGICAYYRPSFVGVEATGFQVALTKEARRLEGMPAVREIKHEGKGKLVRATQALIRAEAGQIILPRQAAWVEPFLEELVQFTGQDDPHDDQVDVLAYAALEMGNRFEVPKVEEPERLTLWQKLARGPSESHRRHGLFGYGRDGGRDRYR
jgi:predicted phage terminase large subunit-like protein